MGFLVRNGSVRSIVIMHMDLLKIREGFPWEVSSGDGMIWLGQRAPSEALGGGGRGMIFPVGRELPDRGVGPSSLF